jgi:hypothetical protein
MRLTLDPVPSKHRPLLSYLVTQVGDTPTAVQHTPTALSHTHLPGDAEPLQRLGCSATHSNCTITHSPTW